MEEELGAMVTKVSVSPLGSNGAGMHLHGCPKLIEKQQDL